MASLTRARIVHRASHTGERVFPTTTPTDGAVRKLAKTELDARETAKHLLAEATVRAESIIAAARVEAANVGEIAARAAAESEHAKLGALYLALRSREAELDEAGLDRAVELARVLAERLVGESLAVDPATIAKLARQALLEARGARTVHIAAHPDDVAPLREHLSLLTASVASVTADATIDRGSLRLRTDLGTLDAHITPQLERLAASLRDALR
jgi:flagellar biosynthesis/type III secretory pathway protein FliH